MDSDQNGNCDTLGLVLCGGAGRRMGGKDKGLLDIGGRPAVARALELLEPICTRCFISANRNEDIYRRIAMGKVLSDLRPGFQGPLAGIEAILSAPAEISRASTLLLLPCDLPLLSAEVPKRLLEALGSRPEIDVIYARTGSRSHYLCAALRIEGLASLSEQLDNGDRAVHRWYAHCATAALDFSGELAQGFLNINRAEDLDPQP